MKISKTFSFLSFTKKKEMREGRCSPTKSKNSAKKSLNSEFNLKTPKSQIAPKSGGFNHKPKKF